MAINYNSICVFDFESGSKYAHSTDPLQLAAVIIDPRKLTINEADVFQIYLKPENNDWSKVEAEALAINGITKELIEEKGVDLKLGWADFVKWVGKYNPKKTVWTAPIAAGMNIKNFDRIIIERLCKKFGPVDDKTGEPTLFKFRDSIDLLDILFLCFENRNDLDKYNMKRVREFLGIDETGSHNAVKDTLDTAKIIVRFMEMFRKMSKNKEYKNSFKEQPVIAKCA